MAIFWTSRFGESERLAQLFAHGLTSCSVNVEMHDLRAIDALEITECVGRNQVIVLTAPPGEKEEPWAAQRLGAILANLKPKKHQFVVLDSCLGLESSVFDVFFKTIFCMGLLCHQTGGNKEHKRIFGFDFLHFFGTRSVLDNIKQCYYHHRPATFPKP